MAYGDKDTHIPLLAVRGDGKVFDTDNAFTRTQAKEWITRFKLQGKYTFCRPVFTLVATIETTIKEVDEKKPEVEAPPLAEADAEGASDGPQGNT
jgi:hypothetical protein